MTSAEAWLDLYLSFDREGEPDDDTLRRLAYEACDGDSVLLMRSMLRSIRDLADQLGQFYDTSAEDVLRMEAYLPSTA